MTVTREEIVAEARSWVGTPYKHQASVKGAGADCLGVLRGVFRGVYGLQADPESAPPYQQTWYERTDRDELLLAAQRHLIQVEEKEILKPAQVLVFRMKPGMSAKHCGIVTHNDMMVHAYSGKATFEVTIGRHWRDKIAGVFEFPEVTD